MWMSCRVSRSSRSEEHTSELQSPCNLVCRLLLEKKKVERVIVPDSFLALDHMLRRFTDIVRGMTVDEARMRRNLESGHGLVFSGQLLLELTARGMRREEAYRVVQGHAMEAWKTEGDFRKRVSEDRE